MRSVSVAGCLIFVLSISCVSSQRLTDENWQEMLEGKEWMIEFFAPWCPACNRLKPTWDKFMSKAKELNIEIDAVDLTKYPSLSGLFSVTSLPTIYHVKDHEYRVYQGNRDIEDLVSFVKEERWRKLAPLSSWLSPESFLMKLVSYLFKITVYFKDLYTYLNEDYGLPNWAVLSIFVGATIVLGLLLGIVLIICIDYVCAPRKNDKEIPEISNEDITSKAEEDKDVAKEEKEESDKEEKEEKEEKAKPAETKKQPKEKEKPSPSGNTRKRNVRKE